jgi:hypothetical protein
MELLPYEWSLFLYFLILDARANLDFLGVEGYGSAWKGVRAVTRVVYLPVTVCVLALASLVVPRPAFAALCPQPDPTKPVYTVAEEPEGGSHGESNFPQCTVKGADAPAVDLFFDLKEPNPINTSLPESDYLQISSATTLPPGIPGLVILSSDSVTGTGLAHRAFAKEVDEVGSEGSNEATIDRAIDARLGNTTLIVKSDVPEPEPSTFLLLGSGFAGLILFWRMRYRV